VIITIVNFISKIAWFILCQEKNVICVVGDIIMNKTDVINKLVTVKKYQKENVYNAIEIIK